MCTATAPAIIAGDIRSSRRRDIDRSLIDPLSGMGKQADPGGFICILVKCRKLCSYYRYAWSCTMIANIRGFADSFTLWFQIFRTKGSACRNTFLIAIAVFADFTQSGLSQRKT